MNYYKKQQAETQEYIENTYGSKERTQLIFDAELEIMAIKLCICVSCLKRKLK